MVRKIAVWLVLLCVGVAAGAQEKKKPGFSKEEFRAKQEAFLSEKAELTKEEAARFFPVYFELQDRKQAANDEGWKQIKKGRDPNTTDAEFEQILEKTAQARINADKLELEYLQKFKQILSAKKIYKVQQAEMKFHRDILKIMHQPHPKEK